MTDRIAIRLPAATTARLDAQCLRRCITRADAIREAVEAYLRPSVSGPWAGEWQFVDPPRTDAPHHEE